jgi:hypothetical protein
MDEEIKKSTFVLGELIGLRVHSYIEKLYAKMAVEDYEGYVLVCNHWANDLVDRLSSKQIAELDEIREAAEETINSISFNVMSHYDIMKSLDKYVRHLQIISGRAGVKSKDEEGRAIIDVDEDSLAELIKLNNEWKKKMPEGTEDKE